MRSPAHRDAIRAAASRALVVELQGELSFSASEALARCIEGPPEPPELVVVDLSRVVRADAGGVRFIVSLAERVHERGGRLALTPASGVTGTALEGLPASVAIFANLDLALEWCEDELLRAARRGARRHGGAARRARAAAPGSRRPSSSVSSPSSAPCRPSPARCSCARASPPRRSSSSRAGTLSVVREGADGRSHRLTTLSAGGTFGELAFVDRRVRAADVRADSAVECRTLPYATIDALAGTDPALHGTLLRNLLGVVISTLHGVNAEIAHLTR